MELVIDANIVISTILAISGKTCDLLFDDRIKLFAPELLLDEFEKHKEEILAKSKLSEDEFELVLSLIFLRIIFVPFSEFEKFISEAKKISPDTNDIEYFALALKLNCPIWSNDKLMKNQNFVKIMNTSELLMLLM